MRCSIVASAASPIWRLGWRSVVSGTGSSSAKSASSIPTSRTSSGTRCAEPDQRAHQPRGGAIVGADDPVGRQRFHQLPDRGRVLRIDALHQRRLYRRSGGIERFAEAGRARVDRRRGIGQRDECHPPRAKRQQVLGDDVAGPAVVDADEVVMPAPRIGHDRAVEKDDGDAGVVEGARDARVDVVFFRRELERREEHARDAAFDVLPAQPPRVVRLRARWW